MVHCVFRITYKELPNLRHRYYNSSGETVEAAKAAWLGEVELVATYDTYEKALNARQRMNKERHLFRELDAMGMKYD